MNSITKEVAAVGDLRGKRHTFGWKSIFSPLRDSSVTFSLSENTVKRIVSAV